MFLCLYNNNVLIYSKSYSKINSKFCIFSLVNVFELNSLPTYLHMVVDSNFGSYACLKNSVFFQLNYKYLQTT